VIPGIGGVELSGEHARESARVINAINPSFVRFRTLYVRRGTPLAEMVEAGTFHAPDEDSMVREIRDMVSALTSVTTTLVSDHVLNLLEEVEGRLPEDKDKILGVIDRYLSLPEEDRLLFQLGRRGGVLRHLSDLEQPGVRTRLLAAKHRIDSEVGGGIPAYIQTMKKQFV
jgi:hypothetical protein